MTEETHAETLWRFPKSIGDVATFVHVSDQSNILSVVFIILTPLLFNLVCTYEYKTKSVSKLFGSAKVACVFCSIFQILCSNTRNYYINEAVDKQPKFETPFNDELMVVGYCIMGVGAMFVVTSFLRLGWFGTWHGDHFGILLSERVTGFPFNVLDDPMYDGAVLIFIGMGIGKRSIAGLGLAFFTQLVYKVTEMVEGPFTTMIYEEAAKSKKRGAVKSR
ncbi:phosphatidylethanolamine N-methyltransferase-like [Watersipora subatra]|uniref:phosphatidylethanolamine N-methyltransferase-like n=1 Tax=Watersipora subatra TaxID=2589382 RepID=UPI00355B7E1A